jgi:hypothetical protein
VEVLAVSAGLFAYLEEQAARYRPYLDALVAAGVPNPDFQHTGGGCVGVEVCKDGVTVLCLGPSLDEYAADGWLGVDVTVEGAGPDADIGYTLEPGPGFTKALTPASAARYLAPVILAVLGDPMALSPPDGWIRREH